MSEKENISKIDIKNAQKFNVVILYATKGEFYSKTQNLDDISKYFSRYHNINVIPVMTGVGKVNALINATTCLNLMPHLIINIGAVGSNKYKQGDIVLVSKFIQRDFDLTALGEEKYANKDDVFEFSESFIEVPFEDKKLQEVINKCLESEGVIIDNVACGTGDSLVTSPDYKDYDIVDMEAYSIAKLCKISDIPFLSLKVVSDGSDDSAKSWNDKLLEINENLFTTLKNFLIKLLTNHIH